MASEEVVAAPEAGEGRRAFRERFFTELLRDAFAYVPARDHESPYPERLKSSRGAGRLALAIRADARNAARRVAARVASRARASWIAHASDELAKVARSLDMLESAYGVLSDAESREVFLKLIEWRVLGPRHVRLPISPDDYRLALERIDRELLVARATRRVDDPYFPTLNRYRTSVDGSSVTVETDETCMVNTFVFEQYAYNGATPVVVEPGDSVLDVGGGYGETVLEFAARAGEGGEVTCVEMDPRNRATIQLNVDANAELAGRVRLVDAALWERSGVSLSFVSGGKMSRVTPGAASDDGETVTTTLDELVAREGITRVDFLKLDVEGAELQVLRGAAETLRAFRPKLAIAAYHEPEDLCEIPLFVQGLDLGYRIFLDHTSAEADETVLFAIARSPVG